MSVGGSLIVPDGGVDTQFLIKLNTFVRSEVKRGKRFFLVAGGGTVARHYRDAGKAVIGDIDREDLDWLGIHATRFNAHLLRTIFQDIANPRIIENYDKKLLRWKEPVVIGAGWKPGWSTDYDAVVLARDYGANLIINMSNIDWVYDRDPRKFKDAKPIKKITWEETEKLVGTKWSPGLNAPFDPVAAQLAKRLGLTVIVANGHDFKNLNAIMSGDTFKGTVIMPFKIDAGFYDREYYTGKKGEYRLGHHESIAGNIWHNLANLYRAILIKIFLNPKRVLDVGCGTGLLVKWLRKFGIEAYGLEISEYILKVVTGDLKPYLKYGDIINIPYKDQEFDLVVTFDVLEHLERSKTKKAVEETARISKKFVLHKVYTSENSWVTLFHSPDISHLSVLPKSFWHRIFSGLVDYSILRSAIFHLPSFFETIFVLRRK